MLKDNDRYKRQGQTIGEISISERKRAEEEIVRLAAIVESTDDAIYSKTLEGIITSWNDGAVRLYGYPADEVIGKSVSILAPGDKSDEVLNILNRIKRGEKVAHFETVRVKKDGQHVNISLTISPIKDKKDNILGASTIARDITEHKLAEAEVNRLNRELERRDKERTAQLEQSNKDLETFKQSKDETKYAESIINTVREPLVVLNQDLRVVKVSRSFYELFKVKPEETVGQLIYDLGNKQWDIPKLRELLETILPQKTTFDNYEVEHDFATIGRRIMLLNARQIERGMGKERIILLAIEDITERKTIEARLEEANKELEAFAYSVSHDLRAPLRSIDGFSQALLEDYNDKLDASGKNYLQRVRAAAQRMGELIDDLLKLSRVTRYEMKHEKVDLSALAGEISNELQKAWPERKVTSVIAGGLTANGDASLLRIALTNLLDNAWKFTSKHSDARIEFGATQNDGKTVYFVRDDGAGLDMKYADKLFAPFQRLHDAGDFPGSGIGLAIVQRVVNRHSGKIRVESAVEQGATFYFTLDQS